ncbi:MAG: amidohydrolase [Acidobacteria bacterium]|nr:amidohydrolase [Acidobacteriota bacterium]
MNRIAMLLPLAVALAFEPPIAGGRAQDDTASDLVQGIEAKRGVYAEVAKQIWGFAEVGYQEEKSSALLQSHLASAGFTVQKGVADIPTAFVASYGAGRPVVAIIGEFDALPGLSQEAVPRRKPIVENGPGHGCGHHLFGAGSVAAAIAVKEWMASNQRSGTLRFYGTPAEEGGSGKVYMVRAGLFSDVDVAIAWHPADRNEVSVGTTLANASAKFRFRGISAHASSAPEKGRSALDGVEAMNYMVNMMREHIPPDARVHYVITRGGSAPNVVPDFAEVYYYARHPDMRVLDAIWNRILKAADAAALGTETTIEHEIIGAVYNVLPNEYLARLQYKNLQQVGGVTYSADEQAFAEAIRKELLEGDLPLGSQEQIQPLRTSSTGGSSDLGDVSWVVPAVQVRAATWVPGTPAHSWQAVACGGTSIGAKGMLVAAKTMALTARDLFTEPGHILKARAEFDSRRGNFVYKPRIGDRKPALDYRK